MNCLLLLTETFLIIWIKMSKNVFLKKAIIYFRSVTENRMLHMRQFIMTKEHHICIWIVPMRDGKLQGKNVFNRQELLWLQDKFPKHMQEKGFNLERGEKGSDREHMET